VAFCCAVLRRGVTQSTQRRRGTEKREAMGLPSWRVGSFCISEWVVRVGRVWRALAHPACLPSPMVPWREGRWGRLGKAWHLESEDAGLLARMGPLPIGAVARGRDEDFGEIAVFGRILRVFRVWTRCALRVTDAHQRGGVGDKSGIVEPSGGRFVTLLTS
jgi:hypothetical protein